MENTRFWKKTVKDDAAGKSGYQCAWGDFSMMGKILFWPSRGQPKAGGHRHWAPPQKGGVICGMVADRPKASIGGGVVRSYSNLPTKCELLQTWGLIYKCCVSIVDIEQLNCWYQEFLFGYVHSNEYLFGYVHNLMTSAAHYECLWWIDDKVQSPKENGTFDCPLMKIKRFCSLFLINILFSFRQRLLTKTPPTN